MARKRTGVCYLNVNYNINDRKRIISCILNSGINLDKMPNIDMLVENDKFKSLLAKSTIETWENPDNGNTETYLIFNTVGFAYCTENDEFDIELGKKIALTRAQKMAFNKAKEFYTLCGDYILDASKEIFKLAQNSHMSNLSCKDHVEELIK